MKKIILKVILFFLTYCFVSLGLDHFSGETVGRRQVRNTLARAVPLSVLVAFLLYKKKTNDP